MAVRAVGQKTWSFGERLRQRHTADSNGRMWADCLIVTAGRDNHGCVDGNTQPADGED